MVEKLNRFLKAFAAASLLLLSLSLILWAFNLNLNFSAPHLLILAVTAALAYLFVAYSIALLKQAFIKNSPPHQSDILDEEEIKKPTDDD